MIRSGIKLIIQQDTREQSGKHDHVLQYFKENNIEVRRSSLYVGDYSNLIDHSVCIDTKKDVIELFMDLTTQHIRFRNECIRAKESGIRLIILVEEELPQGKLINWKSPVWQTTTNRHRKGDKITKANPVAMRKAMATMVQKYGVEFRFCNKKDTGKIIIKILSNQGANNEKES